MASTGTRQTINIGVQSNDGTGDSIREAFRKTNENFNTLFDALDIEQGLKFSSLDDTPKIDPLSGKLYEPKALIVTDSSGTTITQLVLVAGQGMEIKQEYSSGTITIVNNTSTLSTDPNPNISNDLSGYGTKVTYTTTTVIIDGVPTEVTTSTSTTTNFRAKDFSDPIADRDLVTRQYLYDHFVNRDGISVYGTETNTSTNVNGNTFNRFVKIVPTLTNAISTGKSIFVFNGTSTVQTGIDLGVQAFEPEHIVRKDYADTKISLQGVDTIDPATGEVNPGAGKMTGPLILSRNPRTSDDKDYNGLIAATKLYVDFNDFYSQNNLFVTEKGRDYQPDVPPIRRGRAAAYAFASINKAAQYAEKLIATSKIIVGDYARLITHDDGVAATVHDVSANYYGNNLARLRLNVGLYGTDQFGAAPIGNFTIFPGQYVQGVESKAIALIENITKPAFQGDYETYTLLYVDYGDDFDTTIEATIPDPTNNQRIRFVFQDEEIVPIGNFWVGYKFFTDNAQNVKAEIVEVGAEVGEDGVYHNFFDVQYPVGQSLAPLDGEKYLPNEWHVYSGDFLPGEELVYNTNVSSLQISIIVESGEYYEQYPIKIPANTSIRGDEFRRCIIRPADGISSSKWANTYFRRDVQIDNMQITQVEPSPNYADVDVLAGASITPDSASGVVSMSLSNGSFPEEYVGFYFEGNGGRGVIKEVISGGFTVDLGTQLSSTAPIAAGDWALYKPVKFGWHYLTDPRAPLNIFSTLTNLGSYQEASDILLANKGFIQAEVVAWMNEQNFTYNVSKCQRDTGLIVDAITQDLLFTTSSQTTFAGVQYWNHTGYVGSIAGELTTTTSAISYIRELTQKIVVNSTTGTRYQSTITQDLSYNIASAAEQTKLKNEFNIILNILNSGTVGVSDLIVPNSLVANADLNVNYAYANLQANKAYIQAEAVAFVEATKAPEFVYDQAKCYRDVGYMVDSVSFDLLYGGNKQAVQSGVYYYGYDETSNALPDDEKDKAVATYNYLKSLIPQVVNGTPIATPRQTTVPQVISANTGTGVQSTALQTSVDLINTIIQTGPVGYEASPISLSRSTDQDVINAATLVAANKDFLVAEAIAYIDQVYAPFNFDEALCYRDVGTLVEGFAYDLIYGSFNKTLNNADRVRNVSAVTSSPQCAAGIKHIETVGTKILANIPFVPSIGNTATLVTSTVVASTASIDVFSDLVIAASKIVDSSIPGYNPPLRNDQMDVFLCNDANVFRYISCQNHGGFMEVLDPEGQIRNKSPYTQTASSFSQSIAKQRFAGGMFVDGFTGNVMAYPEGYSETTATTFADPLKLPVRGLVRRPQVPTFFMNKGVRYEVDFFADFQQDGEVIYNAGENQTVVPLYSATLYLNPIAPGGIANTVEVIDSASSGTWIANQTNIPISIEQPAGIGGLGATGYATSDATGKISSIVIDFPGTGYLSTPYLSVGGAVINNLVITGLGTISTASIVTGGSGYAVGCQIEIIPVGVLGASRATGKITSVDSNGGILSFLIENGGSGWEPSVSYRVAFGDLDITVPAPQAGFLDTIPAEVELVTAGNRSMLANDFTQVNDLGYGIFVTNGGFMENVSMFTYYCYRSYYSLNGSQVRTLTGSSVFGEYGLCAVGSDPTEVPLNVTLSYPMVQIAGAYVVNPLFPAQVGQNYIFVEIDPLNGGYPPLNGSSIEINHGGIRRNYAVGTASPALDINNVAIPNVYQLFFNTGNISGGTASSGLYAEVLNGDSVIIRTGSLVKLLGFNPESITRPSTSLTWNDDPTYIYHITGFSTVQPDSSVFSYTLEDYNYITFQTVSQGIGIPEIVSGGVNYSSTNTTVIIDQSSIVSNVTKSVDGLQGGGTIGIQTLTLTDVSNVKVGHKVSTGTYILNETFVTYVDPVKKQIALNQPTNGAVPDATALTFIAVTPKASVILSSTGTITDVVIEEGGSGWTNTTTNISIAGTGSFALIAPNTKIAGIAGSNILKITTLDSTSENRIKASIVANPQRLYQFAFDDQVHYITDYKNPTETGQNWAEITISPPLQQSVTRGVILRAGIPINSRGKLTTKISIMRATGHDFVDVGTGGYATTRIPNDLYGPPLQNPAQSREILESQKGRVYYVSSDQDGNFRVGDALTVNQAQGSVSISVPLDLSNLSALSLRRDLGPPINEFSIDNTMVTEADYKVPTEQAVANYINRRLGLDRNGNIYAGAPLGPQFVARNGILPMTGALNMNQHVIYNLPAPRYGYGSDATNKDYVDTKLSSAGTAAFDVNGVRFRPEWGNMTGSLQLFNDPENKPLIVATTATAGFTEIEFTSLSVIGSYEPGDLFKSRVYGPGIPPNTYVGTVNQDGSTLGLATLDGVPVQITATLQPGDVLYFDPVFQAATKKYVDYHTQLSQLVDVSLTDTQDVDFLMFNSTVLSIDLNKNPPIYTSTRQVENVSNNTATILNTQTGIAGGSDITIQRSANLVTFKLVGGKGSNNPITDYHVNNDAQIAQSKLSMTTATISAAPTLGTQRQIQASLGLAQFNSRIFWLHNGWVSLTTATNTTNGILPREITWTPTGGGLLGGTNTLANTATTFVSSASVQTWLQNISSDWSFSSRLNPNTDNVQSLGTLTKRWKELYAFDGFFSDEVVIGGNFRTTGTSVLNGNATVNSNLSVGGNVDITGTTLVRSTLTVDGRVTANTTLGVVGAVDVTGTTLLRAATTINGRLTAGSSVGVVGAVDVTGTTLLRSTLAVNGRVTANSSLGVQGNFDTTGTVYVGNTADFASRVTARDTLGVIGNFDVTGTSVLRNTLNITAGGIIVDGGGIDIDGNSIFNDSLTVTKDLRINGFSYINSGSQFTGAVQIDNNLYFKGSSDNTDPMYLNRTNPQSNLSILNMFIGDDGSGATIAEPSSGATDYFALRGTNDGIHHLFGSNGTYQAGVSISAPSATFSNIYAGSNPSYINGTWQLAAGATFQATYADLAEYYTADRVYETGTVLVFGGDAEVTESTTESDSRVAGVVSSNAAYVMNAECVGTRACIALQGRVPVKVIGKVRKGDLLTTSSVPGFACVATDPKVGTIIGKSLVNKDTDDQGIIEVAVGRN